jgi:hypothetical protein
MGRSMTGGGWLLALACLVAACDDDEQAAAVTAPPNLEVSDAAAPLDAGPESAAEVSAQVESAAEVSAPVPDAGPVADAAAETAATMEAGGSTSVCQRSCAASAASFCPNFQADCVASCQTLIAAVCAPELTAFLECLAGLTPAQLECDEAGAPRPRAGHCQQQLAAASDCLSR